MNSARKTNGMQTALPVQFGGRSAVNIPVFGRDASDLSPDESAGERQRYSRSGSQKVKMLPMPSLLLNQIWPP